MTSKDKPLILKLKSRIWKVLHPETEFTRRIKHRYNIFWRQNSGPLRKLDSQMPIEVWKFEPHWQRQLESKYNCREFAIKHNCRVPELYWQGSNIDGVNFDTLPSKYVLKPILGDSAKMVFLMNDGENLLNGERLTPNEIKTKVKAALWETTDLEFIIEEFMPNELNEFVVPSDYKFYMFNGNIGCIQVISNRGSKKDSKRGTVTYYDENWNILPKIKFSGHIDGKPQSPPKCLPEMIEYARKLSMAYEIFVRVDFYATSKGAVFGEFSPTPDGGRGFNKYGSKYLINMWDKYCPDMT